MKPLSCRSAIINVTGKTYKGRKWVKLRNFKQHSNVKLNIIIYDVVDFHLNLAWHGMPSNRISSVVLQAIVYKMY